MNHGGGEMRSFTVHSTKYDGSLHYHRSLRVVREDPGLIVLYGTPGNMLDSYRGRYMTQFHSLEYYWVDRPYNLEVLWYSDWRPRMHYVNIATPATWDAEQLHFIDLDLDVIWKHERNEFILDDEDEFELHCKRFGYPAELIAQSWSATAEVHRLFAGRVPPFDGSLLAWRPDAAQ